jgi:hypothetical protein
VNGLAAKAADLDARQTRYARVEDSAAVGGAYLQVDAKDLDGTLVEFVEF